MCLKGGLCTFGAAALSLQDRPIATKKERILEILALKSELEFVLVLIPFLLSYFLKLLRFLGMI